MVHNKNNIAFKITALFVFSIIFSCNNEVKQNVSEPFFSTDEMFQSHKNLDFVFEHISEFERKNRIVGAEVLIIREDTIQLHDVVGWSDKEKQIKLQKNSIYRIRSMTKPIVATAILILLDEGKLALQDPVYKYIASFNNPKANSITIQQCLTHTSGLASHDYEKIGLSKPPREFESLSEVVDEIGQIGIIKEQGKHHYSGSGIAVLTEIISIISGTSAEDFIQKRIFTPLEMSMSYTSFDPSVGWATLLNPTYRWIDSINNFAQYWNPTLKPEYKYFRGHGGVYCTAMDYAKFLRMWLHKGKYKDIQILSEETIELAQRTTVMQPAGAPHSHQSLAWMMLKPDATSSKINYFMHGGADGTLAFVYPQEQTIALYFTQSRDHERFIFNNLMALTEPYNAYRKWNYNNEYLDQWKEILLREKEVQSNTLEKQFEAYLGTYKCITNDGFNSEFISKNGQLIIKNIESGYESTLYHYQENEFICRFRPPPDGFISKITFNQNDENVQSFTLEWLNTTKFEFVKPQ